MYYHQALMIIGAQGIVSTPMCSESLGATSETGSRASESVPRHAVETRESAGACDHVHGRIRSHCGSVNSNSSTATIHNQPRSRNRLPVIIQVLQ